MRPAIPLSLAAALLLVAAASPSCGTDESGTGGSPEAGDGKFHPEGNGKHTTEDAACQALSKEQETKALALACAATTRPCPDLLRAVFGTECMEYDEGSVAGCVANYEEQKTCDDFLKAVDNCVITPFPGTEPAGCQ